MTSGRLAPADPTAVLPAADPHPADARLPDEGRDRTGVFLGVAFDMGVTHYDFRWTLAAKAEFGAWGTGRGLEQGRQDAACPIDGRQVD